MKHADIFRALADGKTIEYTWGTHGQWEKFDIYNDVLKLVNHRYTFRIKPEIFTGWINIYKDGDVSSIHSTFEDAKENRTCISGGPGNSWIATKQISYSQGEGL